MRKPWEPGGPYCPEGQSALLKRAMRTHWKHKRNWYIRQAARTLGIILAPIVLVAIVLLLLLGSLT